MTYYDKKAQASPLHERDYCYMLQPKADHQWSKAPLCDSRWIGRYVVEVLPNKNYIVREVNNIKTQVLHGIRLRKFTTDTLSENKYNNEKVRPDDALVISQNEFTLRLSYSLQWSCNDWTYKQSKRRHSTNNQHSSQRHIDASDFVNDDPHSHKYSSQDHVNTPNNDLWYEIEALNENDGMSETWHDSISRQDTKLTTSTEINVLSNNDDIFEDETFSRGRKNNLQSNTKLKFSDPYKY